MTIPRYLSYLSRLWLLSLVLFASQTVATWHDSVHLFHDHTEVCDLFSDQAQPSHLTHTTPLVLAVFHYSIQERLEIQKLFVPVWVFFDAQAPPSYIS